MYLINKFKKKLTNYRISPQILRIRKFQHLRELVSLFRRKVVYGGYDVILRHWSAIGPQVGDVIEGVQLKLRARHVGKFFLVPVTVESNGKDDGCMRIVTMCDLTQY